MRAWSLLGVGLSVWQLACGPGVAKTSTPPPRQPVRPGVPPPGDEAGFRKLLSGEVINAGLWFPSADCQAAFSKPGSINPSAFDAFAHCVAELQLRPTGTAHWADDTSVLTDAVGFEIEARVANGRLDFIGFAGRAAGMPELPTITPETLEALRESGDPRATITAEQADQVFVKPPNSSAHTQHTQYLRVCLNETGAITNIIPNSLTAPEALAAFTAVVRGWRFRPFVVAGEPMSACAIIPLEYPTTTLDLGE